MKKIKFAVLLITVLIAMTMLFTSCDNTEPATEHKHSYTTSIIEPTCTEKGYTTHTCSCGDSYIDSYVEANGHNYNDWTQTKAPTCTEKGEEKRTCKNCDHYETREVAATGHSYTDVVTKPTCTEKGYTTHTCSCGDSYVDNYVEANGHNWGEGVVTKQPTEEADGLRVYTCGVCGDTKEETIEKLPTSPDSDSNTSAYEPTGDTASCSCGSVAIQCIATFCGILGMAITVIKKVK